MGNDGGNVNRDINGGRSKKLLAGIWFSLYLSDTGGEKYECNGCKKQVKRNCHNRKGVLHPVISKKEKHYFCRELDQHRVIKINDLLFYECPLSYVTPKTWRILQLINDTTDGDCNITTLPYKGAFTDQPDWYKEAVRIVRTARAENLRNKRK
jgi:hypothetical protein